MTARCMAPQRRRMVMAGLLAALASPLALGQDPRAALVQQAARDWLAINDKGDFASSWRAAGARFRASLDEARWSAAAQKERTPLGAAKERTVASTVFTRKVQGAPEGDYAQVNFRTVFETRVGGAEQVTLERESDGAWRVVGYVIL